MKAESGQLSTKMNDADSNFDSSTSPEGSEELNGKDASYRRASMISESRVIVKRRIRGALVPMRPNETLS